MSLDKTKVSTDASFNKTDEKYRNEARQLLWHGALLIFLGLLSGFSALFATAPQVAVGAHTVGALQGAILIAVAGAWHLLRTSDRNLKIIKYSLLIGFYANWLGMQLAALWSAGRDFFPTYAEGVPEVSVSWQDTTVIILLITSALIFISALFILWGSRKKTLSS